MNEKKIVIFAERANGFWEALETGIPESILAVTLLQYQALLGFDVRLQTVEQAMKENSSGNPS
jgi:hypothetical protein